MSKERYRNASNVDQNVPQRDVDMTVEEAVPDDRAIGNSTTVKWVTHEFSMRGAFQYRIFDIDGVESTSKVVASITEMQNGAPFLGAASHMEIRNVVPGHKQVVVTGDTFFAAVIPLRITLMIVN